MVQSAGSLGLSTHTPTLSAKWLWSALVQYLSWCLPRVGRDPWCRMFEDAVFKREKNGMPPDKEEKRGWANAGKIDFCYHYISEKHQEDGALAWPLQCVKWPGILRHEDSRRLLSHHNCLEIQLKQTNKQNAASRMMCQAKENARSRIVLTTQTVVQVDLFFNSCLT